MGGEQAERLEATQVDTGRQAAEGLSTAEGGGSLGCAKQEGTLAALLDPGRTGPCTLGPQGGGSFNTQAVSWRWQERKSAQGRAAMQVLLPRLCSHHSHWGLNGPQWFFLRQTEIGQLRGMLGNCPACFWPRDQERVLNQELTAVS